MRAPKPVMRQSEPATSTNSATTRKKAAAGMCFEFMYSTLELQPKSLLYALVTKITLISQRASRDIAPCVNVGTRFLQYLRRDPPRSLDVHMEKSFPVYSTRSARNGSIRAARRAGM